MLSSIVIAFEKKIYKGRALITSIASSRPERSKFGLVMTQSNPTAQFLSCQNDVRGLLLRELCFSVGKRRRFPYYYCNIKGIYSPTRKSNIERFGVFCIDCAVLRKLPER
jgi:hypothetical protein